MIKGLDFTGISIIYFCHDGEGNFVMAKRGPKARDEQGRWDIGGGALEFGDTVENTLRKEILEEYTTKVISFDFLGFRDVHREQNGQPTHWLTLDFKVLVDKSLVSLGEPHKFTQLGWFTLASLPKKDELHSQLPIFLDKYKDRL